MARRCAGLTLLEDQLTTRDGADSAHRSPATWGDATLEAFGKLSATFDSVEQAGIAMRFHRLMGQEAQRTGSAQLWTLHSYALLSNSEVVVILRSPQSHGCTAVHLCEEDILSVRRVLQFV